MSHTYPRRPLEKLTFESVAQECYEVCHEDVAGHFASPMSKHPIIHVKGHPETVWVRPDMGVGSVATSVAFGIDSHPRLFPWRKVRRSLKSGYLPIVISQLHDDQLLYEQTAFTQLVSGDSVRTGREKQAIYLEMAVTYMGPSIQRYENLWMFVPADIRAKGIPPFPYNTYDFFEINGALPLPSGSPVLAEDDLLRHGSVALGIHLSDSQVRTTMFENALHFQFTLVPHERRSVRFVLSSNAKGFTQGELRILRDFSFEDALQTRIADLESLLHKGAQISVPEIRLNDIYKSQILYTHAQLLQGADRDYCLPVQGFQGVWPWEAMKFLAPLDMMGYHEDVRKGLSYFLKIQDRFCPQGNFKSNHGVFGGTIAFEESGWEEDCESTLFGQLAKLNAGREKEFPNWMNGTGAMLQAFANHYFHTRDKRWMNDVTPMLIRAANWIIEERQATKLTGNDGSKVLHYGLLPVGRAYDTAEEAIKQMVSKGTISNGQMSEGQSPMDTYYPAWTDSYSSRGLSSFARALEDIQHPDAERIILEADLYREDICEVMRRTRDSNAGTSPYPERLYRQPAWAEFATGALAYVDSSFIDSFDSAMQQLEMYMCAKWNRGKIGLTGGMDETGDPHGTDSFYVNFSEDIWHRAWILCGEVEKGLLAFYSMLAYGLDQEVYGAVERFHLSEPRYCPFYMDTSASSRICAMILNTLAMQTEDALYLLPGIPRRWLQSGDTISLKDLRTPLCSLQMKVLSSFDVQNITVDFTLNHLLQKEAAIVLRVPHPQRLQRKQVQIDGAEVCCDNSRETIRFSVGAGQHLVNICF